MGKNIEEYIIKANNKQTNAKHYIKVKELIENSKKHDFQDNFCIVDEEDEVYTCFGMDVFKITPKDIEALQSGKRLYFLENGGEYSAVMFLGGEE